MMNIHYLFNIILVSILFTACTDESPTKVLIQPYGDIDPELVIEAQNSITNTYGFHVYVADNIKLPSQAFINVKSPRYRADSLLRFQKRNKPDTVDFVIGLTNKDISTSKRDHDGNILSPAWKYQDWGVFGLGYRPGCSSIVSTFRLHGLNRAHLIERLRKVFNHELGHNLGLKHCDHGEHCVMRDAAETIKTVDFVSDTLCNYCKGRL